MFVPILVIKAKANEWQGLWKSSLNPSTALRIEFTDPNLRKMIKVDKVRINYTNGTEIDMIVEIRALFNFLGKESYYRISCCL